MPAGRQPIPTAVERDLKLEVGFRCPMPQCRESELDAAHLIDHAETGDDSFGNQIMLCPTCHRKHTKRIITTQDLRVLKARLAWENDRYTGTEVKILSLFAQNLGTYFKHPKQSAGCLRFLLADGYIEQVDDDDPTHDAYHLTKTGHLFAKAWAESRAQQIKFSGPDLRPRRAAR
ncbi:HNH endonuclease [Kribbella sp. NBC_01505]|uniref:HNH endonuclease signature motif containing protein n=1 Tax=Kribbella sp. NBC_01505 TaxID=2903580 RepID=UPI00386FDB7F